MQCFIQTRKMPSEVELEVELSFFWDECDGATNAVDSLLAQVGPGEEEDSLLRVHVPGDVFAHHDVGRGARAEHVVIVQMPVHPQRHAYQETRSISTHLASSSSELLTVHVAEEVLEFNGFRDCFCGVGQPPGQVELHEPDRLGLGPARILPQGVRLHIAIAH